MSASELTNKRLRAAGFAALGSQIAIPPRGRKTIPTHTADAVDIDQTKPVALLAVDRVLVALDISGVTILANL